MILHRMTVAVHMIVVWVYWGWCEDEHLIYNLTIHTQQALTFPNGLHYSHSSRQSDSRHRTYLGSFACNCSTWRWERKSYPTTYNRRSNLKIINSSWKDYKVVQGKVFLERIGGPFALRYNISVKNTRTHNRHCRAGKWWPSCTIMTTIETQHNHRFGCVQRFMQVGRWWNVRQDANHAFDDVQDVSKGKEQGNS